MISLYALTALHWVLRQVNIARRALARLMIYGASLSSTEVAIVDGKLAAL
jgi:hypothetical protein